VSSFDWKVIAWSSCKGAKTLEQMARFLGMGSYNLTAGGDGCLNPCPETRQRMSAAKKGVFKLSPEHKAKLLASKLGKPGNRKGAKLTVEQRAQRCVAQKARRSREKAARG
jgi:hypothetical protein